MERKTYTLTQIAQLLGKPRSTLSTWLETFEADIPSVRVGRTTKYRDDAVEVFRKINTLRQEGKNNEEIRRNLFPSEQEKQKPDPSSPLPVDLKGKIFQEALQTRSEVAATSKERAENKRMIDAVEQVSAQVPAGALDTSDGSQVPFHTTLAEDAQEPAISNDGKSSWESEQPAVFEPAVSKPTVAEPAVYEPSAMSTTHISETLSAVATQSEVPQEDQITPVQLALYELNEEVVVLRQALEDVRTEIATSTHYLTQQIATLNEQIRSQQFVILSLQQTLDRARKEQKQSFWRRMFVWQ